MRTKLLILTLLAACFAAWYPAAGGDGIRPGVHFTVPFAVDGESAVNRATVTVAADGKATLRVLYVKGQAIGELTYTLTRDAEPEPGPDPQPDPKPDPKPVPAQNLWGIVVEESLDRTPEHAAVYASPRVRDLFEWRRFRVVDQTGPVDADMEPWRQRAIRAARAACPTGTCPLTPRAFQPVLFLVDERGTLYYEGPPPNTIDLMVGLVEQTLKGGAK
jgi:hypothetical protein